MNSRLDVKNFGYNLEALEPRVMEKLATMMIELTPEDIAAINDLKEKITLEVGNEI